MNTKESYRKLYENEKVKRWHMNSAAGAKTTADMMRRAFALYCETMKSSPDDILRKAEDRSLKNDFQDFYALMIGKGRRGAYIGKIKQAINSYLRFHDANYKIDLKIKNENKNETTEDERVPKREEISNFLMMANPRGKVSISMMAFSGVRPEVLGDYEGNNGLMLGDIEDLDIKKLKFSKFPAKINIRSDLSKTDNKYFTFLTEEGCEHVLEYLKLRKESGEELNEKSPLLQIDLRGAFVYRDGNKEMKERKSGHRFLRSLLVSREIRDVIRSCGMEMRPYVLRAFFATAMDRAEYNSLISHSWRTFFMGHKGDMEAKYSTNKQLLDEQVEEMRSAYLKASKFLEPAEPINREELEKTVTLNVFKKVLNLKDSDVSELMKMSDEELQEKLKEKLSPTKDKDAMREKAVSDRDEVSRRTNGSRQIPVPVEYIEVYMDEGFEYVASLNGDKAIMRLP